MSTMQPEVLLLYVHWVCPILFGRNPKVAKRQPLRMRKYAYAKIVVTHGVLNKCTPLLFKIEKNTLTIQYAYRGR